MKQRITNKNIPESARKEITFMLYNFKNIDKLIENQKLMLIDAINVSANAWKKGIKSHNNTLENQVIKIDENKTIKRLKLWKDLLNRFFTEFKINNPRKYLFIKAKYFNNENSDYIFEKYDLKKSKQRAIANKVIALIFFYAVSERLYPERREEP